MLSQQREFPVELSSEMVIPVINVRVVPKDRDIKSIITVRIKRGILEGLIKSGRSPSRTIVLWFLPVQV